LLDALLERGAHARVLGRIGFAAALEHLGLRFQDLFEIAAHEQHSIIVRFGQIFEQPGDDLDRLAARFPHPLAVDIARQIRHPLILEVALRVVLVGAADAVFHHWHAAGGQHAHRHGRAGARQARDDDDWSAIAHPPVRAANRHALHLVPSRTRRLDAVRLT
jgi:hypothetical protein